MMDTGTVFFVATRACQYRRGDRMVDLRAGQRLTLPPGDVVVDRDCIAELVRAGCLQPRGAFRRQRIAWHHG